MTKLKDDFIFHLFTKVTSVFFNCFDAFYQLDKVPEKIADNFFNILYPDMMIVNEKDTTNNQTREIYNRKVDGFTAADVSNDFYVHLPLFRTMDGKEYVFYFFYRKDTEKENIISVLRNDDFQKWIFNISQSLYGLLNFFEQIQGIRVFFEGILNTLPGILMVFNRDGVIMEWRDNTNISGYPSNVLRGKKIDKLVDSFNLEEIREKLAREKSTGATRTIREFEGFFKTKSGETKDVEFDFSHYLDENQEYFIGVGKDITEQKELERQVKERNKELEGFYANYSKELRFASILQHKIMRNRELVFNQVKATTFYCPYEYVGGDYVGVLPIQDKLYFAIADVVGHGIFSAFYSSMLHSSFHNLLFYPEDIESFIYRVHKEFVGIMDNDNFLSLLTGYVDTREHKIHFVNYGHPYPIFYDSKSHETLLIKEKHNKIISPVIEFDQPRINILNYKAGDKFFIYSDGLIEGEKAAGDVFGNYLERFKALSSQHEGKQLVEALIQQKLNSLAEEGQPPQILDSKKIWSVEAGDHKNCVPFEDDVSLITLEF